MARKSGLQVRPVSFTTKPTLVKTYPTSNATTPCSLNGPRGRAMDSVWRICVRHIRVWARRGSLARHCDPRTAGSLIRVAPPQPMQTSSQWPSTRPAAPLQPQAMSCWPSPTSVAARPAPIPSGSPTRWQATWASNQIAATTPKTSLPILGQTTSTPGVVMAIFGVLTVSLAKTSSTTASTSNSMQCQPPTPHG